MTAALKLKPATEAQVQSAVLDLCERHGAVAAVWRANNGGAYMSRDNGKPRFVRFASNSKGGRVDGLPDIQGVMWDGRALFIEVKRPGEWKSQRLLLKWRALASPNKEQQRLLAQWAFLRTTYRAGAHTGIAESVDDAIAIIEHREPLGLYEDHPRL